MAYSVEKLWSRGDPKILKGLQAAARLRHEGILSCCTRLLASSSGSLGAPHARINARTLTLQQNRIAANLEFFNRIGRTRSLLGERLRPERDLRRTDKSHSTQEERTLAGTWMRGQPSQPK